MNTKEQVAQQELQDKQTMKVSAIENGTVIDHIPADSLFKVISLLGLDAVQNQVTFGTNLQSRRMGRKAIIKINDLYCHDKELSYLALVAPSAKINTIRDFKVVEKREVCVPATVDGMVRCANPMCITNHEAITTHFKVWQVEGQLSLECRYCEKSTSQEQIVVISREP